MNAQRTTSRQSPSRMPLRRRRIPLLVKRVAVPLVSVLIVVGLLTTPMACTATVRPPVEVDEPVEIVLLDHGRHSALALPTMDGGMTRYAYGDWHWYALGEGNAWSAIRALLWPSRSALGYRRLAAAATPSTIERHIDVVVVAQWPITVERGKVQALREELEQIITSGMASKTDNEYFDLTFVPHPDAYSYFHNSNHVTAGWLRQLGCEVSGLTFNSSWNVAERSR